MTEGATAVVFDIRKKRVLLVKRRDIPIWVLPGGGVEKKESVEDAAIRETEEESGYKIKLIRKIGVYTYIGKDKRNTFFEGAVIGGQPRLNHEASKVEFWEIDNLPPERHPYLDLWLADALATKKMVGRKIKELGISDALFNFFKNPLIATRFILTKFGIRWNTRD